MPVPNTNASHDFLFAKLHGMWANAIKGEALDKLLRSATVELLQRALHEIGLDGSRREVFHKDLILRELNMLGKIARLLDVSSAGFYNALVARNYFDDLKTMLHYRFFPERESDISWLLVNAPGLPEMPVEALLDAPDTQTFINTIPLIPGLKKEQIAAIVDELEKDLDIMTAECALDRLYYARVMDAAHSSPFDMRADAANLMGIEIDIVNLCMLLRNVKTYHFEQERLAKLWIPGGVELSPKRLEEMSSLNSVPEVVEVLPMPMRRLLSPFQDAELYLSENALWTSLHNEAVKIFRDFDRPAKSIAAFPFLVHFETLNIGRVFEGVHFGIPARDMQDMMIGA